MVGRFFLGLLFPVALILAWQISVTSGLVPSTIFPTPRSAAAAFIRLLIDGDIFYHARASLLRLSLGFAIGLVLGLMLGVLVGISQWAQKLIAPTLRFLAPIPPIAFIPVFIALFGIADGSKVALIAVGTFFVIYSAAFAGIRGVDRGYVEVARLYRKSALELFFHVLMPSAISQVATAARIALGLSWVLLIAAEVISSSNGLGWLIWDSRNFGRVDDMVAGMLAVGVLGFLSDIFVQFLERCAVPWRSDFEGV